MSARWRRSRRRRWSCTWRLTARARRWPSCASSCRRSCRARRRRRRRAWTPRARWRRCGASCCAAVTRAAAWGWTRRAWGHGARWRRLTSCARCGSCCWPAARGGTSWRCRSWRSWRLCRWSAAAWSTACAWRRARCTPRCRTGCRTCWRRRRTRSRRSRRARRATGCSRCATSWTRCAATPTAPRSACPSTCTRSCARRRRGCRERCRTLYTVLAAGSRLGVVEGGREVSAVLSGGMY
mmetsp:Transcript_22946/g.58632  ORF Transcript_22946/g.58632 Transcript_22946/m.58632 type:complete len:239 (-) Transcript_22946:260-976(-)